MGIFLLCPSPVQASSSHRASEAAFARATALQRHLEVVPNNNRTRAQYQHVLDAYRAVYHGDPASPDAARSIAAVADMLVSEGLCFHDATLLHDAVAQWEFLRHQYPTSSLRQRALFEEAQIQQYDLR
ncbi:MAG: N-acetylmuramoyl-L-alanine amidase, partial [Acidobacteriaceae bacterium]